MPHLPLLVNIAVALGYALAGGLLARRIGLPTIVGYLVAGVALGPFTPGFHGDPESIHQMAEFGVILLMFGVGLHFSFRDLWQVRQIVIPGAIVQLAVVTAIGYALARHWGFSGGAAWIFGLAGSVASTVVQMRSLMDHGWLDTPHGKVAIGWLIVEDLLVVVILVLLPMIAGPSTSGPWTAVIAIGKALLFVALMMFAGARVVPFILGRVVHTRSRELFVLVALTMAVGTALASSALFGVSLALGAFVAGIVVGESQFSHQIGADLLPFREAFAVVFFVSVGMLVDPRYVLAHWDQLLLFSAVIVGGKTIVSGVLAVVLGASGRTTLVLATGRGQIGEFSFILGQSGLLLGVIDENQYSLILAAAIVSITVNPLLVGLVDPVERWLKRRPAIWSQIDRSIRGLPAPEPAGLKDHVVIVGCGRVGRHIAETLSRLNIPRLVIEADPIRIRKLREIGVPVLYGEAGNSEILEHAGLSRARALVITLPDDAANLAVVSAARKLAPHIHIISRASTWEGARNLKADGAGEVVRPELEGGVEIVRRTLLELHLPMREVQRYTDLVRREGLDESERPNVNRTRGLDDLVKAAGDLELGWLIVGDTSPLSGVRIVDASLRQIAGVSVVAISRERAVITNPGPEVIFVPGDRVALIGTPEQVASAEALFSPAT